MARNKLAGKINGKSKSSKHYAKNLKSKKKKNQYDKEYSSSEERKKYRVKLNLFNRKNGKKTIVILSIPAVVAFPWKDDVDAIICDFYGGEVMA